MSMPRRKRCPFCRCLYWPDPRTRWRQWACSKPGCQEQRRVVTQRRQRLKNPSDKAGRRYRQSVAAAKSGEPTPGVPPKRGPLVALPWDEARDEIAPEVLVMLALFGRLLFQVLEDEKRRQPVDNTGEYRRLPNGSLEDETAGRGPAP
jgi:hypothetical protein